MAKRGRHHAYDRIEIGIKANLLPDRMWIAVMGPDTPALGCRTDLDVTQNQVAATVAELLGEDYHAAAQCVVCQTCSSQCALLAQLVKCN